MSTAKITSKGQITLPKAVRDFLKLDTGDCIDFVITGDEVRVRPKTLSLKSLKGSLAAAYKGKPVSIDEMQRVIRKHIDSKILK